MNDIKENLKEEFDGVMMYFSYYYEYMSNEISHDFYEFAFDELKHAKFWLDMLEIKEDSEFENYKAQYDELMSLVCEGGEHDEY